MISVKELVPLFETADEVYVMAPIGERVSVRGSKQSLDLFGDYIVEEITSTEPRIYHLHLLQQFVKKEV